MNAVRDLIEAFREDERDTVAPHLWTDSQLLRWVRQAVDRFCEITGSVIDRTSGFTLLEFAPGEPVDRHPCIIDILEARTTGQNGRTLELLAPGAQPPTSGLAKALTIDSRYIHLHPAQQEPVSVQLAVVRRPLRQLEMDSRLDDVPASARESLLLFVKHRAYRVNDAEMFDPAKADAYLMEFERECQKHHEVAQRARRPGNIRFRW